jgi:geranylgeranyl reductase family protein
MSQTFDLIVVGAGPGGSNAAAAALDAGLTVAQIDRYSFPRVKPCAGGMTIKACRSLLIDVEPIVQRVFHSFEFNVFGTRINQFTHPSPVLTMVVRPEFDNFLVEKNSGSKNFTFYDNERVTQVEWDGEFAVRTDKRVLRAHQLVGADGAYGMVNRAFRVASPKGFATAIEVNLEGHRQDLVPCFDFGVVPQGYGWVFPKDGHCSIGLYTLSRNLKDLRARLQSYLRSKNLTDRGDLHTDAFQFPYGGYRLSCPQAPLYIVGDAGGFGDAITGEGIYHALESGRLAGKTAAEVAAGKGSHRNYYRRLWKSVLPDTFLTYQLSQGFYRDVNRAIRFLENLLVWRPFVQGYSEGATFTQCLLKGGWFLAKSAGRGGKRHKGLS